MITVEKVLLFSIITILSLVLLGITFLSYRRYKNKKLLYVCMVFLFLFLRGILLSLSLFMTSLEVFLANGYFWVVDVVVLVLLYGAYALKS